MLFDPKILIESPLEVLATLLIIVVGKSLAAWAIVRAFGRNDEMALTISASLAQIGEFSFILAGLGLSLEILPQHGKDLVVAGALLSIVANPLLFVLLERYLSKRRPEAVTIPEPARQPLEIRDHAIVVGYGRVGEQLAKLLRERGVPVAVVVDSEHRVDAARADGFPTIRGNAVVPEVLEEAAAEHAKMAVFAIPNALEAGETIARLKQINPEITVLARAHSDGEVTHLLQHGADGAVMAERELAYSLAEMVMSTPPYRSLPARP